MDEITKFIDSTIERLKTSQQDKPLLPLAGQEYRDNIIKLFQHLKQERSKGAEASGGK